MKENGHERVLCIADNRLRPDYERYLGLCDGLGAEASFWEIPMRKEERVRYYDGRQDEFRGFTAVFAVSDYYAVDLMYYLTAKGVRIPDEISVIGFDDTVLGRMVSPALTTVTQDVEYRARKAVEYLTKMKADREYSMTEVVPVRLTIRESARKRPLFRESDKNGSI